MSRPLQIYDGTGITVTFEPSLCTHSGRCVRGLRAVFDVRRRDWVHPDAASVSEVAAQVARCPSGALKYTLPADTPRDQARVMDPFDKPIPAAPIPTRDDLVRAAQVLFPGDVTAVMAVLDGLRLPPEPNNAARSRMAVLVLAEGRFEKLREFAGEAERDFRNVLYWYEYMKPGVRLRLDLERRLAQAAQAQTKPGPA